MTCNYGTCFLLIVYKIITKTGFKRYHFFYYFLYYCPLVHCHYPISKYDCILRFVHKTNLNQHDVRPKNSKSQKPLPVIILLFSGAWWKNSACRLPTTGYWLVTGACWLLAAEFCEYRSVCAPDEIKLRKVDGGTSAYFK